MTTEPAPVLDAASWLLDRWWRHEQPLHAALQRGTCQTQRETLGKAAVLLNVHRRLIRSCDVGRGLPRFEPLRGCLASVTPDDTSEARFAAITITVARAIGTAYGHRLNLAAASKLLWVTYRHPFVIYDSVVRRHLGTRPGDYAAYVSAWQGRYAAHEAAIRQACAALAQPGRARQPSGEPYAPEALHVVEEEWFRRRVLDFWLWQREPRPRR